MKVKVVFKRFLKIICLGLVALLSWAVYVGNAIAQYGVKNEMQTADAIVVLGAGTSSGKPSPVFRARLDHGIWLYDNGYGKKLILTGGKRPGDHETASEVARRYAESKEVFRQDILIETKSRITEEQIASAQQIARREGLNSMIIVSDPIYMKRAMLIARAYHVKAYASPTAAPRNSGWKSKLTLLTREIYFYTRYLLTPRGLCHDS
jgi:uncharacterized SAM-binding protein YcdF (DUF218 family)